MHTESYGQYMSLPLTPIPMAELISVLLQELAKPTLLVFGENHHRVFIQAMQEGDNTGWLLYDLTEAKIVRASDNWEDILEDRYSVAKKEE